MRARDTFQAIIDDYQIYHSDMEINEVTVREGGTLYGCDKQASRELFRRSRGLKQLYVAREMLQTEIAELDGTITVWWRRVLRWLAGPAHRRRLAIRLGEIRGALPNLEKNIADTEREFVRFYGLCAALHEAVGPLTPERRAQYELELAQHQIIAEAALSFLLERRIKSTTYQRMCCMPHEVRTKIKAVLCRLTNLAREADKTHAP